MNKLTKRLAMINNDDFNRGIDSAIKFLQKALNEIQHVDDTDRDEEEKFERIHEIFYEINDLINELNEIKF